MTYSYLHQRPNWTTIFVVKVDAAVKIGHWPATTLVYIKPQFETVEGMKVRLVFFFLGSGHAIYIYTYYIYIHTIYNIDYIYNEYRCHAVWFHWLIHFQHLSQGWQAVLFQGEIAPEKRCEPRSRWGTVPPNQKNLRRAENSQVGSLGIQDIKVWMIFPK